MISVGNKHDRQMRIVEKTALCYPHVNFLSVPINYARWILMVKPEVNIYKIYFIYVDRERKEERGKMEKKLYPYLI